MSLFRFAYLFRLKLGLIVSTLFLSPLEFGVFRPLVFQKCFLGSLLVISNNRVAKIRDVKFFCLWLIIIHLEWRFRRANHPKSVLCDALFALVFRIYPRSHRLS